MKLVFRSIKNGTIFESGYDNLEINRGTIEFKHMHTSGGLAVVYAPNGTGKSSFTKVLSSESGNLDVSFIAKDENGKEITRENNVFHVIPDQINRNVVRGKETDYLIGPQIRREYELREKINTAFFDAYNMLARKFKSDFKISKVGDYLLSQFSNQDGETFTNAYTFIRSIVNTRTHGKDISQDDYISYVRNLDKRPCIDEHDENKRNWIIADVSGESKIVNIILNLDDQGIEPNPDTKRIEMDDVAIGVLQKYHSLDKCIVCDKNDFHGDELLVAKKENRKRLYDSLDQNTKDILDNIVICRDLQEIDPFEIRRIIAEFLDSGNRDLVVKLKAEIKSYIHIIISEMVSELFRSFDGTHLFSDYDEYQELVKKQPELDSEELLFIEEVINENIGKNITIEREEESKNYKLKIGTQDLIGTERENMELSTGEQNFISLSFELLLARHCDKDYIIMDDPISSFDSIYKNKIAYCIIKFLENKKQIVLTHNTDLIRLLDVQLDNCFNLYIMNNAEKGENGFISVSDLEKKLLINFHELIVFFENKDNNLETSVRNKRLFLMAMIPFMRGYAHISLDPDDDFGRLSKIMHGYGADSIDVAELYKKQFGYDFGVEKISVDDVLNLECCGLDIIDKNQYPLLGNTLEQTLIYYHLRMLVEKELVELFKINVRDETLSQIIQKAFRCGTDDADYEEKRRFKVFFTSRKTLLNEFNHFEGNMNIFQPAIDITYPALMKEILDIQEKLGEVKSFVERARV